MKLYGVTEPHLLPEHLIKQFYCLTFRFKSPMKAALRALLKEERKGTIVWLEDEDKVQAWGLLLGTETDNPEIMLYTRRSAQGKGLATQVFWALRNTLTDGTRYIYYPHDKAASKFYAKQYARRCNGTRPLPEVTWLLA